MMMMGIVLSYVRMKTDNMFYSSLFHFVHNASTIVASIAASFLYMFSQGTQQQAADTQRKRTSACI